MHVTMEQAQKAIEAARKKAVKLDTQMCIAVVDFGREPEGVPAYGRRLGRLH